MSETTRIEWTDATWNPWQGCRKVSPGCDNCYAERLAQRMGHNFSVVRRSAPSTFNTPLRWQKQLAATGERKLVFTCSISDFFHRDADEWRAEAWDIMSRCPNITFQVLTKRIDRAETWYKAHGWLPNVWLGTSVESQAFTSRLDTLARIPAPVRFVSCEPCIGAIDLKPYFYACGCGKQSCECKGLMLHWVIVGGESGPHARPMHPDWVRGIRDDCKAAGVAYFFKQWGEYAPLDNFPSESGCALAITPDGRLSSIGIDLMCGAAKQAQLDLVVRVGKARAGATLDGCEWREMPERTP